MNAIEDDQIFSATITRVMLSNRTINENLICDLQFFYKVKEIHFNNILINFKVYFYTLEYISITNEMYSNNK